MQTSLHKVKQNWQRSLPVGYLCRYVVSGWPQKSPRAAGWRRGGGLVVAHHLARDAAPLPRDPLPFPALFIASRSDPYHDYEASEELAYAWGARIADAGHAGHINAESGHGPWPEGLMTFAGFLKRL